MRYPAYPTYVPSGIHWLPQMPKGWGAHRLKWTVTSCENGVWGEDPDGGDDDVVCLRVADFDRTQLTVSTEKLTVRAVDERQRKSRELKKGDLLIEKSGGGEKQLVGCVVLFDHEMKAVTSNFVARMSPAPDQCPRYWTYAHAALYSAKLNYLAIKQTTGIQNLEAAEYLNTLVVYPPLVEQKLIAKFLLWKTSQIETLIAKKQTLIERLREQRLSLITQAVTKGLNPTVPLQPSGVAWLGSVPSHWAVKRIKFIATVGNGSTPTRDDSTYWFDGHYPWLNSSVVNLEVVDSADQFVTDLALQECHLPKVQPPAVLVGITGQGKTRGMATTLAIEATINQHLAYVKPSPFEADVRFLRRIFDAAYSFLRSQSEGGGSTKGAITCEQIAEMAVPVPPFHEQIQIADHLELKLAYIDALLKETEAASSRLTEYRSALITNAVTGQIDVRKVKVGGVA